MEADEAAAIIAQRIKVVCRVRPSSLRENHGSVAHKCVSIAEDRKTIVLACKPTNKHFTFDHAAGEDSTQEELFEEVGKPVTQACLQGYNGTVFAYGQTGSGKTFTTFGPSAAMENALDISDPRSLKLRGLVPRVLEYLFDSISAEVAASAGRVRYNCRCSFYEIFNERVFDLLDGSSSSNANGKEQMGLNVREDTRKGVYVENLIEEGVTGADAAGSILQRGYRNRHVGETAMNRESSRSHAVFTLVIEATEEVKEEGLTRCRVARFNLVDLAGSERQKSTQAGGDRLKEASSINGSLSTLGQVISALVEKSCGRDRHIAYRNSRLTFLLRDSLGGNSKTMLVAAVSPADVNFAETLSTLKFAQRAKMIKNMAVKNEDTSGSFEALKAEVSSLRAQLAAAAAASGVSPATSALTCSGGTVSAEYLAAHAAAAAAAEADPALALGVLIEALRRGAAAEAARDAANRRAASLAALAEKAEKTTMQKEMILKFRDSALAAQRKKESDAEKAAMAEEIAFLQKELEGGDKDSQEVSKWRLAYKEAEAQLAELKGITVSDTPTSGSGNKQLVWTAEDQTRFTCALDAQVVELAEEVALLRSGALSFEHRLEEALETAAHTAQAAASSKELEAKQMIEDALLKKLQESHKSREEALAALQEAETRASAAESNRTELLGRVGSLAKHLEDERRRAKGAEEDRDQQLAALQAKIETVAAEREVAQGKEGSELSQLRQQLATAIKDNGLLLQRARDAASDADDMEDELDRCKDEIAQQHAELKAEKVRAEGELNALEAQMRLQEEAHDRELEDRLTEKLALDKEYDDLQAELTAQQQQHELALQQSAAAADAIRQDLSAATATAQELEGKLASSQDDCDTLTDEVAFSNGRVEELEEELSSVNTALDTATTAAAAEAQRLTEAAAAREQELTAVITAAQQETEAARAEAAALQATLSERDVTITTMTSEATSAAAKLQSVEEQLCEVEQRAAAATVAHDTAAESAAVQIKQGLQQLSEQADTVKAHEAKIAELKAALEAAAAAAVVAQQDATFAFNATQAQLRAKHDEAATAMQRADYTESELRRVTAEGAATKASLEAATSSNTALHSELSAVQSELATATSAAEASAQAAADKEAQFKEKIAGLEGELSSASSEKASVDQQLAEQAQRVEELTAELAGAHAEVTLNKRKLSAVAKDLAASSASTSELRAALLAREDAERELQCRLAAVTADLEHVAKQLESKTAQMSALESKLEATEQEKAGVEDAVTGLQNNVDTLTQRLTEQAAEAEALLQQIDEHRTAAARHTAAATALNAELEARTRALSARTNEVEGLQRELEARTLEGSALKEALTDLQAQLAEAMVQVSELRAESEELSDESTAAAKQAAAEKHQLLQQIEDLELSVARLQEGRLTAGERGALEGRLCAAQSESHALAADVLRLTEAAANEAELRATAEDTAAQATAKVAELTAKVQELQHTNASLVGHTNIKQKIKQHEKLKDEIIDLQRMNKELTEEAFRLRKQLGNSNNNSSNSGHSSSAAAAATGGHHTSHSSGTLTRKGSATANTATAAATAGHGCTAANEDEHVNNENATKKYNLRKRMVGTDVTNHTASS